MDKITGIYIHFKGKKYAVIGKAIDKNTQENYVFYRQLYAPFEFWIRPWKMFFGIKEDGQSRIQRFVKILDDDNKTKVDEDLKSIKIKHSETKEIYHIIKQKGTAYIVETIEN